MRNALSIFLKAPGSRPMAVFFCLTLAGIFDLLSVGVVLPVLGIAGGLAKSENASVLNDMVSSFFQFFSISPSLENLLVCLSLFLGGKFLLSFGAMAYVSFAVADVATSVRTLFLDTLFRVRWGYFTDHPSILLSNTVSREAENASETYRYAAIIATEVVKVAISLVIAFLLSGFFFLIAAGGVILFSIPISYLLKFSHQKSAQQWKDTTRLSQDLQDMLHNMKALKSMALEEPYSHFFRRTVARIRRNMVADNLARYGLTYGQDLLILLFICTGVFMGSVVFRLPLPELLTLGFVFMQMTASIKKLQYSQQAFGKTHAAYVHCLTMIAQTQEMTEEPGGPQRPTLEEGCRFEGVFFSYGEKPILKNLNLDIPARQITVLTGPSGSGKTTIVDLLIGFYRPKEGKITTDHQDLCEVSLKEWRQLIGYVPQDVTLLNQSIFDNVTLGDEFISEDRVEEALRQAGAWTFVCELPEGIRTEIGQLGSRLSGGQRQRIALARALVKNPRLLILDEVTSALDLESEQEICQNILALRNHYTVLAITHRPAWVAIASKVYEIEKLVEGAA